MSFFKARWWRPAAALGVLALAVLALSLTGTGTAKAGNNGTIDLTPNPQSIGVGGTGDIAVEATPADTGTSIWIVQFSYNPAVVQVATTQGGDPICTPLADPDGGGPIAEAAGCDVKDTNNDQVNDTAVAFGGWVQNDNGTPRGFTTKQTVATFTFKAADGATAGQSSVLTTDATSYLGPNGENGDNTTPPTENNGLINITGATGTNRVWGDWDCSGAVAPRDGQADLAFFLVKTPLTQTDPCPDIGANVTVGGTTYVWGDGDCSGAVAPRDGQADLAFFLGKPALTQTSPCAGAIGATVTVSG